MVRVFRPSSVTRWFDAGAPAIPIQLFQLLRLPIPTKSYCNMYVEIVHVSLHLFLCSIWVWVRFWFLLLLQQCSFRWWLCFMLDADAAVVVRCFGIYSFVVVLKRTRNPKIPLHNIYTRVPCIGGIRWKYWTNLCEWFGVVLLEWQFYCLLLVFLPALSDCLEEGLFIQRTFCLKQTSSLSMKFSC